jgi:hypothetical protein
VLEHRSIEIISDIWILQRYLNYRFQDNTKETPTEIMERIIQGDSLLFWPVPRLCTSRHRFTAGWKAHTNFADESAWLTADNVRSEAVTILRSQEELKMLSLYTLIFSQLIVSLKYTGTTILEFTAHETPNFTGLSGTSWVRCEFCEHQYRLFCLFMYPCKWNHASSEKKCQLRIDFTFNDRL